MTCTMDQRSARGYCPDDTDGHLMELCSLGLPNHLCPEDELCAGEFADASFCSGPSDQGDKLLEEVSEPEPPAPAETLPAAGLDPTWILVLAVAAMSIGRKLITQKEAP